MASTGTSLRDHRFWIGLALAALVVYLVIKLYNALLLRIPIVVVGPEGVVRTVGFIQPYITPIMAYEIVMSLIMTAALSSIASVLIYSSLIAGHKRHVADNDITDTALMRNHDFTNVALTNMERAAISVIRRRGGVITQAELGRELGLSKYQVSRLVKRLEAKGIIEKRRAGVTNVLILRGGPGNALDKGGKGSN
ncbi:MAG: MarR family transcriptional regulator [Vulcanisaeta sp.]|nr:MarR family transcriptional regulator [Vulcanisaeta sp.]MCG2870166.1 MarR family transcriptional regulator [Vulcanisaeta sp.]